MPSFKVSRTTTKSREALWKVIADYPNIADWTAGLTSSHATSESTSGTGATRHCDLKNGGTLEETVRAWDDGSRLVISIDEATKVPIKRAQSTFTINEDGGGGRTIEMETDFTPKGGPVGLLFTPVLKLALKKGNRGLLDEWHEAA